MAKRWMVTTPLWEKSVGLFGLVLIIITVALLIVTAVQKNGESPEFRFQVTNVAPISNGYLVSVEVHNEGGVTAENLQLAGTLQIEDSDDETVMVSVEFFPPMVVRHFQFYFSQ